MRIHSDVFVIDDIHAAAERAGAGVRVKFTVHGSRSRARAFNVTLTGTSSRVPGWGKGEPGEHAATWDEWGMFLAELFRRDPDAVAPSAYESAEHFRWVTGARFDTLTPADQHDGAGHKWSGSYPNLTGVYYVAECIGRKGYHCTATVRRMAHGHTFDEIAGHTFAELEGV